MAAADIARFTLGECLRYPYRPMPPEVLQRWARHLMQRMRFELLAEGTLPTESGLIAATHRSALDILVLLAHAPGRFLSRHDVAEWPLAGTLAKQAGTVFVDRDSPTSGFAALRALKRRAELGDRILLFPEGRTHAGDTVGPLKPGVLRLAQALRQPIVPIGLAYPPALEYVDISFATHLKRAMQARDRRIGLCIGQPLQDPTPALLRERLGELASAARALRE